MKGKPPPMKPRMVEIVRADYQPSKAELGEDMSIDTSPTFFSGYDWQTRPDLSRQPAAPCGTSPAGGED